MAEMELFCTRLNTRITVKRLLCKPSMVGSAKGFTLACDLAVCGECDQVCDLNLRLKTSAAIPEHVVQLSRQVPEQRSF